MKPGRRKRIVLGLDEKIPSRVAASVLRNQDCELFAIHLHFDLEKLGLDERDYPSAMRKTDLAAMEKYCESLGIFLRVVDITQRALGEVYDAFWMATLHGAPDAPSLRWNSRVLFPELLGFAGSVGAESIATGHFAGAMHGIQTYFERGLDQSGNFADIDPKILPRIMLPLGEVAPEMVLRLAREIGVVPATPKEEQSPDRDLETLLADHAKRGQWRWNNQQLLHPNLRERAAGDFFNTGPIRSTEKLSLGEHPGIPFFSIGDAAPEHPGQFVLEILPQSRTLVVGPPAGLAKYGAILKQVRWLDEATRPSYGQKRIQVEVYNPSPAALAAGAELRTPGRLVEFPDRFAELRLESPLYFSVGHRVLFLEESRLLGSATIVAPLKAD